MSAPFVQGQYYHIYNRGCNKEQIFFNEENYRYLLRKIKETYEKAGVDMIAYCLMPNHYHLLVRQGGEIPLSSWLRYVFNGYTQAINIEQNRSGTLFQGRAKHILIDTEAYLMHVARYIHRNPVEAGLVSLPSEWLYSNYLEWVGEREGVLVNRELVKEYFPRPSDYRKFVEEYKRDVKMDEEAKPYLGEY